MEQDLLPLLMQNKLLQGLTDDQVRRAMDLARKESFAAGTFILRETEIPARVYLLAQGRVQVRRTGPDARDAEITTLEPGSFFGEMSVITGAAHHSASVVAKTTVTVLSLSALDFTRLLLEHPETIRNVLANVVIQLQGLNKRWMETLRVERQVLEWKIRERNRDLEEMNLKVHRELSLAQTIQRNLLPDRKKSYPGLSISTDYVPCDELGGDITGVFQIDETRLGVYGGDVCGHGIYAAMVMSYVKKLIETSVKRILLNRQYVVKPPGAVLTSINQSFISEISQGDPEIYLTLFLGVLNLHHLSFEFSSAGTHIPPLVLSNGEATELFDQSDYPIGHVANHEYATARHVFARGDSLLFVSDGVIEAQRGQDAFGMPRLKAEALRSRQAKGTVEIEGVLAAVRAFLGDEPPQDDMCLLTIDFLASDDPTQ